MSASNQRWVVVESTPGYMPDDDDPYVTDDYRCALRYMVGLVRRSRDYSVEGGADIGGWLDREAGCAFLVDEGRPYDLGRYFEVMPCEDGCGMTAPNWVPRGSVCRDCA